MWIDNGIPSLGLEIYIIRAQGFNLTYQRFHNEIDLKMSSILAFPQMDELEYICTIHIHIHELTCEHGHASVPR